MAKLTKAQRAELREVRRPLRVLRLRAARKGWHADHVEPVMRESGRTWRPRPKAYSS